MSKLHNVRGRITYISSHANQENLYAVFDRNGLYLATKKIGKNNPKAEQIKADNEVRMLWNHEVERAIVSQVPADEIRQIKQTFITKRIRQSIEAWGNKPYLLTHIILTTTKKLAPLTSKVLTAARELKNKLFNETLEKEYANKADIEAKGSTNVASSPKGDNTTSEDATFSKVVIAEPPKPQIPPRPIMPLEAAAYPKLQKVKITLDKHNNLILEAERERNELEIELSDLKWLERLIRKKELESRISFKNEEIQILKSGLSNIVRQHGFVTVQDFYKAFYTAQRATDAYQKEYAKWDEAYGEKATPMHEKMQRYKEQVTQQNSSQPYHNTDRGAR